MGTLFSLGHLSAAVQQAWPPFVLVTGLLLVGLVAHEDGLFEAAARLLGRVPGSGAALYVAALVLVAAVTAVLNLDTSVVFLTPVLIHAARQRGLPEAPFVYGAVFVSNAASLFLPGSNLTNLLVLSGHPVPGATFGARLLPASMTAAIATIVLLALIFRGQLAAGARSRRSPSSSSLGLGAAGTLAAATLIVVLARPAAPVLVLGGVLVATRLVQGRLSPRELRGAVNPVVLLSLFGASIVLGALARTWAAPGHLLHSAGRWGTAGVGALAAVALNNLPAAVLLSARAPAHPRALLLGLNLGPNLAVSGSLSAYLWWQAVRRSGARASIVTYSRYGLIIVPVSLGLALLALATADPGAL